MNNLRLFLLTCCWLAALGTAQAQGKVTGVVQDSVTHEPLAFSSVFLANTTLGATTSESGTFEFPRVPAGTYDIVGSYVGYRLGKQSITVGTAAQQVKLELGPMGEQLGEVIVKPEPNKPEHVKKFTELFLGGTTFSEECHISNSEQVRIFYDDSTKELSARAKEFLQIDNDALGYRLKYYGMQFDYNAEDQTISYFGQPVFEEMTPRDDIQKQVWTANRATAYTGSFMHFLRSVYNNNLKENDFLVQQVRLIPNPRFARADKRRLALLKARPDGRFSAAEQDSIAKWEAVVPVYGVLKPAALPIDSIRRVSTNGKHTYLRFRGELQVAHFGEAPDPHYNRPVLSLGDSRTPYPAKRQVSRLRLQERQAEIQSNGALMNPLDVFNGEYWGFERIGEFLPYDYVPPTAATTAAPTPPANDKQNRP